MPSYYSLNQAIMYNVDTLRITETSGT